MNAQDSKSQAAWKCLQTFNKEGGIFCSSLQNVHTPKAVCQEVIADVLSDNLDLTQTFATSNLEFVLYLCYECGVKKEKVWFFTESPVKKIVASTGIYAGINVILTDDCSKWENSNMTSPVTFGRTVTNPPYQDVSKGEAKRWPLWHRMVMEQVNKTKDGGRFSVVIPSSCLTPGDMFNYLRQYDILKINLNIKKDFPASVGSTFCYLACIKQKTVGIMTQIVTPTETITVNLDDYNFLPPEISSIVLSIGRKFFGSPARWSFVRTTEYHTTHKNKWGSPDGKWPVFHTNAQTLRTNTPHSNNGLHRVAITLSGYSNFKYVHNAGCSQAVAWSDRGTKQEAERSLTILNSKLYQFILNTYKYSGWNSLDIIKALPFVNVSTGTDSEIYALFSLTPDEIQLVESGV